ncbi:VOC family protein [Candidatus Saccharibacteria bacterium]|nr:VOC family protein [Candidatus Saccharibacteria bacterium]
MSRVSVYLNFMGKTEEAFLFYKSVFKTEFVSPIQRMGDVPADPNQPPLPDDEKNLVMHVELPIIGGISIMGTDMLKSMGHVFTPGNNMSINLMPDTRAEAEELFDGLLAGGSVEMPLQVMFWGDIFGSGVDKYGVRWMVNCSDVKPE